MRATARTRYGNSPMRHEMRGRVDGLPSARRGGALRYAIGFQTPHPLSADKTTGNPLLYAQPQGSIAQRINDEINERERKAEIARREEQERQEQERQRMVEALLPNAGDLSDPANAPMLAAIQELTRRHQTQQDLGTNNNSWDELASLFD